MTPSYKTRHIESTVLKGAEQFPSLIVTGPRQSGKTTLLRHLFSDTHKYVSLDDPDARRLANEEPRLFLENSPPPLMIDEVQYAPGLFPYLKIAIDQERAKKGRFILSGSQSFPLMQGIGESLAGRIVVLSLLTFSTMEQQKQKDGTPLKRLQQMILRGGYPELVVDPRLDAQLWFSGYMQTYLERDIRNLRQVGDLLDFQRFLELLASVNGRILNLSELSRDLGVAVNTVKAWISMLEASHQIILVKPFYRNKGKRIVKSPKVYFLDTGFLCYLNGITQTEQILKGPTGGPLFETLVLGELIRGFYNRGEIPRIYWWRTSNGSEVDFIVERGGKITPIEVKMTSNIKSEFTKGLIKFIELFEGKIDQAYIITIASENLRIHKKIDVGPYIDVIKKVFKE